MSDRGSVAPLIAGYLALILLAAFGAVAVGAGIIAGHRIQGVADFAVLYSHDRSVVAGVPDLSSLKLQLQDFLGRATSAQSLEIVVAEIAVVDEVSQLRLCARYREVLFGLDSYLICKNSRAKSYLVP
uniref:hypothetical protein n=1 Tax=Aquiluna sp. TaxID=2053504 RepID=UPI00404841AA